MRATPTRLPDELLAPACATLGAGAPEEALSNPALRAAVQAAVRAQLHPNPKARRVALRPRQHTSVQSSLGFDGVVDIKRRAANDLDEE
ncbi:MAG: hypothetical protein EPN57_20425 [Paraburkholderia sp.]|nr:MAG: hypothetical protein EPN57_20425 [Paraburkholderia sp.]